MFYEIKSKDLDDTFSMVADDLLHALGRFGTQLSRYDLTLREMQINVLFMDDSKYASLLKSGLLGSDFKEYATHIIIDLKIDDNKMITQFLTHTVSKAERSKRSQEDALLPVNAKRSWW